MLGSHHSSLTMFVYKKGSDPTSPQNWDCPVVTPEQGKYICDQFISFSEVERVEVVDEESGEVIYARGYRSNPAKPVKAKKKDDPLEQGALFDESGG